MTDTQFAVLFAMFAALVIGMAVINAEKQAAPECSCGPECQWARAKLREVQK